MDIEEIDTEHKFYEACRRCLDIQDYELRERLYKHGKRNGLADDDALDDLMNIDFEDWKQMNEYEEQTN